jgi:hypothetical protein
MDAEQHRPVLQDFFERIQHSLMLTLPESTPNLRRLSEQRQKIVIRHRISAASEELLVSVSRNHPPSSCSQYHDCPVRIGFRQSTSRLLSSSNTCR